MKKSEQIRARTLRREGYSIKEITKELRVAKSSVSIWVRDIKLTQSQKKRLSEKGHSFDVIEKRRAKRLANEDARRQVIVNKAVKDIKNFSKRDLLFFGVAAYWGEGKKSQRGSVEFYNSDPRFVQIMMRFFREVCEVPESKFKARVCLHSHLDNKNAEKYWSNISGISRTNFQKTVEQHNKSTNNKKDNLPMGTFTIAVYDTKLFLKIMGWMEGVYKNTIR